MIQQHNSILTPTTVNEAGQSNSSIVGLRTYAGSKLITEGVKKDIRYNVIEIVFGG